jgi:hypothetical protein
MNSEPRRNMMSVFKKFLLAFILLTAPSFAFAQSMIQSTISCGTAATQFLSIDTQKKVRLFSNTSAGIIYFGPAGVTISSGQPVAAGQTWDFSNYQGAAFCIVASGTLSATTTQY